MAKNLLILCHDLINAQLDRRITQQAAVWVDRGWDVTLIGMREKAEGVIERWSNGVVVLKVDQRSMPRVEDRFWEQILASPAESLAEYDTLTGKNAGAAQASEPAADQTGDTRLAEAKSFHGSKQFSPSEREGASPAVRQPMGSIAIAAARRIWRFLPPEARARGANHIRSVARGVWRLLPLPVKITIRKRIVKDSTAGPLASVLRQIEWYPLPFTQALLDAANDLPAQVILAADLTTLPASLELAGRFGSLILYDAHELYSEQVTFSQRQRKLLKYHEGRGLRQVFIAYTVSDAFAGLMQEAYGLVARPRVLTNAPDFVPRSRRSGEVGPLRKAAGLDAGTHVLLFHGGFSPHRNIETLARGFIAADLPNVHLVFLGYGDRSLVELASTEEGAKKRISILDAVPAAELDQWVGDADHVVIPYPAVDLNTTWCSPNKLYDCIALGVPLIVNRELRNVSDIIAQYGIGLSLDMSTPERLAEDFRAAFSEPLLPVDFSAVREKLGWQAQRRTLESWIDEVEARLASEGGGRAGRMVP